MTSQAQTYIPLSPALPPERAAELRTLIREVGPLPTYVDTPRTTGFGAGLVRRHDALMHYVQGQSGGAMESMADMAARLNLFRAVLAEGATIHVPASEDLLYRHPPFLDAARRLTGRRLVVPDMLYVNILLPGQELAVHTDTPEYRGLSKLDVPEWFLVCMHHSGLFESWRVRIAGGVTFLDPPAVGGAFLLHPDGPDGPARRIGLADNTAVMLDADALFHGVERVGGPDVSAPPIRPGMSLHPVGEGAWEARKGEDVVAAYTRDDVRISVQWKAHCFADEEERGRFADHSDDLTEQAALDRMIADLQARGVVESEPKRDLSLALTLIETYIDFPEA